MIPVALFVYKRLEHTRQIVESLAANTLSGQADLFVFSDAGRSIAEQEEVSLVRQYIHQTDWQKRFAQVTIIEAERNRGLARSIIDGVTQIIEKYGKIIVLEDDLVVSEIFLEYMDSALAFYKSSDNVWSISGYSFPMKSLVDYPHDVYYGYRGCSWGWGTWKDRWEKVDWNVTVYHDFILDRKWIHKFNRGGNDLAPMLQKQMEGKLDSWAVRWCFAQSNLDMFTIYPKNSLVENKGHDGSGTHCGNSRLFDTVLAERGVKYRFEELPIDKRITREFWRKNSDTLDKKIKRNLKKIFNK